MKKGPFSSKALVTHPIVVSRIGKKLKGKDLSETTMTPSLRRVLRICSKKAKNLGKELTQLFTNILRKKPASNMR